MITAGQFPTTFSWPAHNFSGTDYIVSLAIDDPEFSDAYWIGWIAFDDLPGAFKLSRYAIDTDNDIMTFTDATRAENVDVCLVSGTTTGLQPALNQSVTMLYKNDVWSGFSRMAYSYLTNNGRLLNSVDINTILYGDTYLILSIDIDNTTEANAGITLSLSDIYNKTFSKTVTSSNIDNLSGPAIPSGISFDVTNANIDGTLQTVTSAGHTITYHASCFGLSGFFRPITTAGGGGGYYNPVPVVRLHDDTDRAYLLGGSRFYQVATSWSTGGFRIDTSSGVINQTSSDFFDTVGQTLIGGYVGSVSLTAIRSLGGTYGFVAPDGANFAIQGTGRGIAILRRMYTWYEIYTTLSYLMRFGTSNTYTTDSGKYYPHISDSNQFLGELINGETDRDELRPWQIAGTALDAESDEYKPSDKPPYIPPDPDDRDKIGDSIGFNRTFPSGSATGLFTLYALRQAHVSQLGAKLWATLNDPTQNFWQNLQFAIGAFAETGSADISGVLDFITSIRIYPFALINLPGYTNAGTGAIRLGTGRVALDLGSGGVGNVGIMGQYTGLIDAGSAYIPEHFEDFRDLEDVTISVYLPYIGNIPLNPAEVTGCTIAAEYAVDLTSGSCVAYLLLSGRWGFYPIGVYSGTIGADIPLTASQGNRLFSRQIAAVISPILASASAVHTEAQNDAPGIEFSSAVSLARTAVQAAEGFTGASLTPPVLNGGGANFAGFGAPQTAYIQIRRAQYAYTARSFPSATFGNRTAQRATIGSLSGFTRCINPDVSKIPAPAAIQQSIKAKLESGVYI